MQPSFRRTFIASSVFLLAACSHTPRMRQLASSASETLPALSRVIDAHAHWDAKPGDEKLPQPGAAMEKEYVENHVVGAVVHLSRKRGGNVPVKGDTGIEFIRCAAVVPGETTVEVERGLKAGEYKCMKVYLGYVAKYPNDPFYHPFYRLAEKYSVPVVFHTGDTYDKDASVKFADPLGVDEVAIAYKKVNFVIAHMGNPWFQSAAEVVYKDDNVYVDTSALMLGDLAKETPESVDELVVKPMRWFYLYVENPKKIMFGTDWPLCTVKSYIQAVQKAIPKEHWEDVFYNNAARIFKFGERPMIISKGGGV